MKQFQHGGGAGIFKVALSLEADTGRGIAGETEGEWTAGGGQSRERDDQVQVRGIQEHLASGDALYAADRSRLALPIRYFRG